MTHPGGKPTRRACLAAALAAVAGAGPLPSVRLGVLQFGTVQWVAEVIRRHALDQAHGFALETVMLANNDAGRVALMAQSADIVVSDWFFVAAQRAAGTALSFAPFTSASGALMVPSASPVRGIGDLPGRRLGVAGGPLDKSWLLFQAAARTLAGIDVAAAASVSYGAPPLLNAKLRQGELDAVLTFWNFAARLEAEGFRQVITVDACARALDLPEPLCLIGFVFHEAWARANPAVVAGFLAAAAEAEQHAGPVRCGMAANPPADGRAGRRLVRQPAATLHRRHRAPLLCRPAARGGASVRHPAAHRRHPRDQFHGPPAGGDLLASAMTDAPADVLPPLEHAEARRATA